MTAAAITVYSSSANNRIITSVDSSTVQGEPHLTFTSATKASGSELRAGGIISASQIRVSGFAQGGITASGDISTSADMRIGNGLFVNRNLNSIGVSNANMIMYNKSGSENGILFVSASALGGGGDSDRPENQSSITGLRIGLNTQASDGVETDKFFIYDNARSKTILSYNRTGSTPESSFLEFNAGDTTTTAFNSKVVIGNSVVESAKNNFPSSYLTVAGDISSTGIISTAGFGSTLGTLISGSLGTNAEFLRDSTLTDKISGSLGENASLIRSLTATTISESFISASDSLEGRIAGLPTSFNVAGDSGGNQEITVGTDTLTIEGGDGINTAGSTDKITIEIDSGVVTTGSFQTLSNKTLNQPIMSTMFNTGGVITFPQGPGQMITTSDIRTLTNKTLNDVTLDIGASGSAIKDEDNMDSNSDTHLATQQSIKAYVDSQVTAQDLDFQGDSGGALSIDLDSETLDIAGGKGIETTGSSNTLTVSIDSTITTLTETQTLTNKTLTAPIISSISNSGTLTLPTSTDTLVGRATTDTLTNKTLTNPTVETSSFTNTASFGDSGDKLQIHGDGSNSHIVSNLNDLKIRTNRSADKIIFEPNNTTIMTITDDGVKVEGDITANQYIVSSSVTHLTQSFSSGSTIFGDTIDDIHQFTGSVSISGSIVTGGETDDLSINPKAKLILGSSDTDVTEIGRQTDTVGGVKIFANTTTPAVLFNTSSIRFNHDISASGDLVLDDDLFANKGVFSNAVELQSARSLVFDSDGENNNSIRHLGGVVKGLLVQSDGFFRVHPDSGSFLSGSTTTNELIISSSVFTTSSRGPSITLQGLDDTLNQKLPKFKMSQVRIFNDKGASSTNTATTSSAFEIRAAQDEDGRALDTAGMGSELTAIHIRTYPDIYNPLSSPPGTDILSYT